TFTSVWKCSRPPYKSDQPNLLPSRDRVGGAAGCSRGRATDPPDPVTPLPAGRPDRVIRSLPGPATASAKKDDRPDGFRATASQVAVAGTTAIRACPGRRSGAFLHVETPRRGHGPARNGAKFRRKGNGSMESARVDPNDGAIQSLQATDTLLLDGS